MVIKCIICEKEFNQRHPRYICCSSECTKKRRSDYNKSLSITKRKKLNSLRDEFRIPQCVITEYGEDVLRDNKELLETLQIINRLTGHHYVSEEDRQMRRSVYSEQCINRRKLKTAVEKICKCCGKTYTKMDLNKGVRNSVTCSKECSKELKRISGINWNKKQRSKKLEI